MVTFLHADEDDGMPHPPVISVGNALRGVSDRGVAYG
jgi:hypothetical protein